MFEDFRNFLIFYSLALKSLSLFLPYLEIQLITMLYMHSYLYRSLSYEILSGNAYYFNYICVYDGETE